MQITVIGTGYVGLVSGACFAEMGNDVICVDVDEAKVAALNRGVLPIYEPGLEALVANNVDDGRLRFTARLEEAMADTAVFFIAVGTPPGEDGSADLQYVLAAARELGRRLEDYAVITDKSTVPVGTAARVRAVIQEELDRRGVELPFDVVSNPEFLKEGAAVEDFMRPDRIIVGLDSQRAREVMQELYAPFNRNHQRVLFMSPRDAEMSKYAANAMLATKISFMNEIAGLCEHMAVDVENVRLGIGADNRIGYSFIYPGCGYGGSCFPKDVKALIAMARQHDFSAELLNAVEVRNQLQKRRLVDKVYARFGAQLQGLNFALWGLSFKPGTDDMREAPSKVLLQGLIEAGAQVCAYDPVAAESASRELPQTWFTDRRLALSDDAYSALEGADALLLVTEWKQFRHPDFKRIKRLLRQPLIFDGRNQYDPQQLQQLGFEYYAIGRGKHL